jgi:hypothetical protein
MPAPFQLRLHRLLYSFAQHKVLAHGVRIPVSLKGFGAKPRLFERLLNVHAKVH